MSGPRARCHLCSRSFPIKAFSAHAASCLRGGTMFYTQPNFGEDDDDKGETPFFRRQPGAKPAGSRQAVPPRPPPKRAASFEGKSGEGGGRPRAGSGPTRSTSFSGGSGAGSKPSSDSRSTSAGKKGPRAPPPPKPFSSSGSAGAFPGAGPRKTAWGSSAALRIEHGRKCMAGWDKFLVAVQRGGVSITYEMVPWIGTDAELQLSDIGLEGSVSAEDLKKTLRLATLRWHPDKFQQQFGPLLHADHAERITERVTTVASGLNRLRQTHT